MRPRCLILMCCCYINVVYSFSSHNFSIFALVCKRRWIPSKLGFDTATIIGIQDDENFILMKKIAKSQLELFMSTLDLCKPVRQIEFWCMLDQKVSYVGPLLNGLGLGISVMCVSNNDLEPLSRCASTLGGVKDLCALLSLFDGRPRDRDGSFPVSGGVTRCDSPSAKAAISGVAGISPRVPVDAAWSSAHPVRDSPKLS